MTIREAINHAKETAERQRKDNDNCKYKFEYGCKGCADYYSKPCNQCAEEHEQLAEWLEELQQYREIGTAEECRAARKRQMAKKPIYKHYEEDGESPYVKIVCPNGCRIQLYPVTKSVWLMNMFFAQNAAKS